MEFKVDEFFKDLDGAMFTHHGYYCKHCGEEIYVKNLGSGICAIRCKGEAGFHIVRADSVFEAEELYGEKKFANCESFGR